MPTIPDCFTFERPVFFQYRGRITSIAITERKSRMTLHILPGVDITCWCDGHVMRPSPLRDHLILAAGEFLGKVDPQDKLQEPLSGQLSFPFDTYA